MAILSTYGGHSEKVKMQLFVNGTPISVAQMGRDFLIVDKPFNLPPAGASLVMQVDDSISQWNVHLPHGISAASKRVVIAASL